MHALANQLWIGHVPQELRTLTFPEQLLITHIFPRVFVFKLFPKAMGDFVNAESLQRGMRGTVSSYPLNVADTQALVEGNLMPQPVEVLATVITVTFVGLGNFPRKMLQSTFRVRREAVRAALSWLCRNNKRHYGHIKVSKERLTQLPEDNVPVEIAALVCETEEVGSLVEEAAGYVNHSKLVCKMMFTF